MRVRELLSDERGPGVRDDHVADSNGRPTHLSEWFVLESRVLGGEQVLVISDETYLDEARAEHPDLVVYFPFEVKELLLRNASPMLSRRIHMIKKVLDGVIVPRGGSRGRDLRWLPRGRAYRRLLGELLEEEHAGLVKVRDRTDNR